MVTFIVMLAILLAGYLFYGKFVERIFRPDDRPTPAVDHPDGVDFVPHENMEGISCSIAEYRRYRSYFWRAHGRGFRAGSVSVDRVRLDTGRRGSRLYERHDLGADERRFGVGDCRKISGQGGKADHACFFGHTADTGGDSFRHESRSASGKTYSGLGKYIVLGHSDTGILFSRDAAAD